uniref:Uncharacterized protein n=1 Tax=Alexandrium catenella TaxID=2925 RepID=A0A7S1L738_ALECA|mmetsp:Transcript_107682/g.286644  ORF Transcript_107682/g.286644 Transcript_107682/m.286644 type:complete len:283 (+) Transcript_107682:82-930(+)
MAQQGCLQGRPPLERLRVICITCLVLDSLFVFIYGMMALSHSSPSDKTQCYEEHHYMWHDVVAGTLMISAFVGVGGAVTHGTVSCAPSNTEQQLVSVSRFAHSLVSWTFVQALLEAIAYGQEPQACLALSHQSGLSGHRQGDGDMMHPEDRVLVIYQVVSTMLWLCWVTGCVAAGVLGRRCIPLLPEACDRSPDAESSHGGTPQTVGMPVMQLPSGMTAVNGAAQPGDSETGLAVPVRGEVGAGAPVPLVGAGGGLVAQGRPVAGAESTKGGGGSAGPGSKG